MKIHLKYKYSGKISDHEFISLLDTKNEQKRILRNKAIDFYRLFRHITRYNRGPQRDFYNNRRNRRSPSPYRGGRNRNRRSRSSSYNDRYRNRRNNTSRDRSSSQENRTSQPPQAPPAPNFQNEYVAPSHYQEYPVQQGFHYDYVPMTAATMMQVPPTAFPAYPPPPTQDYAGLRNFFKRFHDVFCFLQLI